LLSFQHNGGPSLNFSETGKRSRVGEEERVYRNALCSNEGITRHGCSVTSKVPPDGQPLPPLSIMKFQVVALPGHRSFPSGLARPGPRSSQCKEAKPVSDPQHSNNNSKPKPKPNPNPRSSPNYPTNLPFATTYC
jgi:hypothetical protein